MTLLEKLQEIAPQDIDDRGRPKYCPGKYPELNRRLLFGRCGAEQRAYEDRAEYCRTCWDCEYEPPVTPNQKRQAVDLPPVDKVDHPSHYTAGRFECIDEMVALFGVEAVKAFCRCNVHKYRYRADHKNGAEDLAKAEWYMAKLMELERGGTGV